MASRLKIKFLFIHKSFPGQFKNLAKSLQEKGHLVKSISISDKSRFEKAHHHYYQLKKGNGKDTHPLILETESKVIRGESVSNLANKLKHDGYTPDIIIGHPGWGEMLFLRDIWPNSPQIHYIEFIYGKPNTDSDFPDLYQKEVSLFEKSRIRMKNANSLLNMEDMDIGITPTQFQFGTLPSWAQQKTSVIHDGIDTEWARPKKNAIFELPNGKILSQNDRVTSFVNRTFEPYRGIHSMMNAIPLILDYNSTTNIVLVGKDTPNVSYGPRRTDSQGWFSYLKKSLGPKIDWSRVHLTGPIEHSKLLSLYQITGCHVYLTYPFILSWSMLEAMSCGALIVGSDTQPVREVIINNLNGYLVPFHSYKEIAAKVNFCLDNKEALSEVRINARATIIGKYNLDLCVANQLSLIESL